MMGLSHGQSMPCYGAGRTNPCRAEGGACDESGYYVQDLGSRHQYMLAFLSGSGFGIFGSGIKVFGRHTT
jgi:hypothetical protein